MIDTPQPETLCWDDEPHDIENMMQDREHIVYQCTQCGLRMEYPRNITPEQITEEK